MPPPSHNVIDAPLSLGNFFPADSDDDNNEDNGNELVELDNCYEVQRLEIAGSTLQIRQYAYHSHNANRVWPGTFNLADFLLEKDHEGRFLHHWGSVLELGTATGVLAILLVLKNTDASTEENQRLLLTSIVTSDVEDEHGDVQDNVKHNFDLNGLEQPPHVPHTWGTGWKDAVVKHGVPQISFDTIVASDILLYVSAYPALVLTLEELMPVDTATRFVMSWNRRMKESVEFFDRMKDAGFHCVHLGKCIYSFTRKDKAFPG